MSTDVKVGGATTAHLIDSCVSDSLLTPSPACVSCFITPLLSTTADEAIDLRYIRVSP